jgi:creatinine amidohydrolase
VESPDRTPVERLDRLTWTEAAERIRRDPRILLPVGSCIQHGPHLPLGLDTVLVERLAEDVARRTGLLLAPTLCYGVSAQRNQEYAGTSSLDRKTLHRVLNELVDTWERHGVREVVLLTTNGFARHIQALAMVDGDVARIRVVDTHAFDLGAFLEEGVEADHGGEVETSLLLCLAPELVRRDSVPAADEGTSTDSEAGEPVPAAGSNGTVGRPALATREKGERIYAHLVESIADRLSA